MERMYISVARCVVGRSNVHSRIDPVIVVAYRTVSRNRRKHPSRVATGHRHGLSPSCGAEACPSWRYITTSSRETNLTPRAIHHLPQQLTDAHFPPIKLDHLIRLRLRLRDLREPDVLHHPWDVDLPYRTQHTCQRLLHVQRVARTLLHPPAVHVHESRSGGS